MRAEEEAMLDLLPDTRGLRAIDLACGSGRYLRHLQNRGAACCVGLDLSAEMLARAPAVHSQLARATMLSLPLLDGSIDLVVCGLAVGHLPDLNPALREVARVLKPGGTVLYSDFHPFGHLAGWKRGFRANGSEYSVRHYPHLYAEHHAACAGAGLTIDAVREPCAVDESGRRAWGDIPAALIVRAVKAKPNAD
ncbi:MAG: class I SAM-dependent methyltransferase [Chloroflexi bacterium]|nr:class I SAM-dependent methyltransferase [Chloroflexota bacterium]